MPVAFGLRAEPVRVHVHRLQARRQGAGHVVPQAVPDVQDGAVRGHVQGLQREVEDPRVGLGHADHRGVQDDAHGDGLGAVRAVGGARAVGGVAQADAAQVGRHGAVGVGDHAHGQALFGEGAQAFPDAEAGLGPAARPGALGDLEGELLAVFLGHAAGRDVGSQVVRPPGVGRRGPGLLVLGGHGPVVGAFQGGQVGVDAGRAQRRQQVLGPGEQQNPAGVEQDRADSRTPEAVAGGMDVA